METLLQQDAEVDVVGRASTGMEVLELAKELEPDLMLMDISLPMMDGYFEEPRTDGTSDYRSRQPRRDARRLPIGG